MRAAITTWCLCAMCLSSIAPVTIPLWPPCWQVQQWWTLPCCSSLVIKPTLSLKPVSTWSQLISWNWSTLLFCKTKSTLWWKTRTPLSAKNSTKTSKRPWVQALASQPPLFQSQLSCATTLTLWLITCAGSPFPSVNSLCHHTWLSLDHSMSISLVRMPRL